MRRIIRVSLALFGFCLLNIALAASERIHVGWNAGAFRLAEEPLFETKGLQKTGTVELILELSPEGTVKQVKTSNGLPELCSVAIESAKNWRFVRAPNLPETIRVYVYFTLRDGSGAPTIPAPPPPPFGQALGSVEIEGVSSEVQQQLLKAVGLEAGSMVTSESLRKAAIEAHKIDPHLVVKMTLDRDGRPKIVIFPR
ncbi:MAG TPA: energy transducer TonB [Bryobacteraceae bacterium]